MLGRQQHLRTRSRSTGDLRADLSPAQLAQLQQTPPPPPRSPIGAKLELPEGTPRQERRALPDRHAAGAKWGGADHALYEFSRRHCDQSGGSACCKPSSTPPPPPSLLAGEPPETILATAERVTLIRPPLAWTAAPDSVLRPGTLYLTTFRVLFVPSADVRGEPVHTEDMPLAGIHRLSHKHKHLSAVSAALDVLKLRALDGGHVLRVVFGDGHLEQAALDGRYAQRQNEQRDSAAAFADAVRRKVSGLVIGSDVSFAHHYRGDQRVAADRWLGYDAKTELIRLGVDRSRCWLLSSANKDWALSATYPALLAFPRLASSATVRSAAEFRSKGRLPTLSWLEPTTYAAIQRSAQPLVGLLGATSPSDNRLLEMVAMANVHANTLHIVDARPYSNATANRGHGGGFEDCSKMARSTAQGLPCWKTTISFADIANIHVVRASLEQVHRLYRSGQGEQAGGRWLSKLEGTGWIDHLSRILHAASDVAERVSSGQSCLIHCSDGWDRTSQLTSIAMLLLDPYYRTKEGFAVLVEKEWCSFGHKFRDRLGHFQLESTLHSAGIGSGSGSAGAGAAGASAVVLQQIASDKERSPIFFQFLDVVFQLTRQFPDAFEFTELFLLHLHQHTTSGK